ncbi:MAG: hypothetical protein GC136_04785 [Alphaproteobacteria bacterium]|nr:hypothetical protein [Alphaproteobacteria bacterium]
MKRFLVSAAMAAAAAFPTAACSQEVTVQPASVSNNFNGCYLSPAGRQGPVERNQVAFQGQVFVDQSGALIGDIGRDTVASDRVGGMAIQCNESGALELVIFDPQTSRISSAVPLRSFMDSPASLLQIPIIQYEDSCRDPSAATCMTRVVAEIERNGYRMRNVGRIEDGALGGGPSLIWVAVKPMIGDDARSASNVYFIGVTEIATGRTTAMTTGVNYADGRNVPITVAALDRTPSTF